MKKLDYVLYVVMALLIVLILVVGYFTFFDQGENDNIPPESSIPDCSTEQSAPTNSATLDSIEATTEGPTGSTAPTEGTTGPTEGSTSPTEAPTDPTERPTDPAEEPTDPTEQPTDPTEAPTDPTERPTDPTENTSNGENPPASIALLTWREPENGSIKVTQGDTPLQSPAELAVGAEVTVTVTVNGGCELGDLTVEGISVLSRMNGDRYTFTVTEDATIVAAIRYASKITFYVSPNASGSGTGTKPAPYSLQQVLNQIKALRSNGETANADITVCLMDGTYCLAQTLTLTADHTSSTGTITFQNVENAKPVITSGVNISTGWTDADNDGIYERQIPKVGGIYPMFRDLYVNGKRATLARTQNHTFAGNDSSNLATNNLEVAVSALSGLTGDVTGVELNLLVEWKHQIFHLATASTDTGIVTLKDTQWQMFNKWDSTKRALGGRPYWLQNHLSFLDEPGEFYYDQKNGTVYYMPHSNEVMNSVTVEYGALDILVELNDVDNIIFDGITFTGTTANWITKNGMPGQQGASQYGKQYFGADVGEAIPCAAIFGDYATGIAIKNCVFDELGGSGIIFRYGAEDIEIIGNTIRDLGISGVQIGVPQVMWNQVAKKNGLDGDHFVKNRVYPGQCVDVTISNNYVTNIGLTLKNAAAISVRRAENLKITHNKIVHVPYSGITAGWGMNYDFEGIAGNDSSIKWDKAAFFRNLVNAEISYNSVEDFMHSANDGGGIYVNGANAEPTSNVDLNNTIHHNYIRAGAYSSINVGIYHDGAASNWLTSDNFVEDVDCSNGPIFFQDDVRTQYTHNITACNNYSTVSAISQKSGASSTDILGNARNIVLTDNTLFPSRDAANDAALRIMEGAGLQEAYAHLETAGHR